MTTADDSIIMRSVHVHGFHEGASKITTERLRESLSSHGDIKQVILWVGSGGKQHAFVIYESSEDAERAAGFSHSFQTENIRNNPQLQSYLFKMISRSEARVEARRALHGDVTPSGPRTGRGFRSATMHDDGSERRHRNEESSDTSYSMITPMKTVSGARKTPSLLLSSDSAHDRHYQRFDKPRKPLSRRHSIDPLPIPAFYGDPDIPVTWATGEHLGQLGIGIRYKSSLADRMNCSIPRNSHTSVSPLLEYPRSPSPSLSKQVVCKIEVSTPEAGQIFLIDEAVLPLREAFKEDPVEAHRRASLMVIEHGNKGLYDLAEAIGKESIALARSPLGEAIGLQMRPLFLALATIKSKRAKSSAGAEQEELMRGAAEYIDLACAESGDQPAASLNIIRKGLLTLPNSENPGSKPVHQPPTDQTITSPSFSQSVELSMSQQTSATTLIDVERERRALRAEKRFLEALYVRLAGEAKGAKRRASEDLEYERRKRRRLQDDVTRAAEEKEQVAAALADERERRQKAEDELWQVRKANYTPKSRTLEKKRT